MSRVSGRLGRTTARVMVLAILASGGLALALGLGLPDPGAAERAFAALIGLLGCLLAMRWLRLHAEGGAPQDRFSVAPDDPKEPPPRAPNVEAAENLERALSLGVSTIGSYNLLVLPRLQALASAKLGRAGCRLSDGSAAAELLGDGWPLVDPATPPPPDAMAPGVSLQRVTLVVEALEKLP